MTINEIPGSISGYGFNDMVIQNTEHIKYIYKILQKKHVYIYLYKNIGKSLILILMPALRYQVTESPCIFDEKVFGEPFTNESALMFKK